MKKKMLFITGTRADYGKIKSLLKAVDASDDFELFVYVSGMHLLEQFGNTYREIEKDGYKNIYVAYGLMISNDMSYDLGDVICNLTNYVHKKNVDMIVVHGDRIDALAGAVVGALNNIRVVHIEGGEVSGTIDESIRHAISKFAHIHMVCNESAKKRLIQLGEEENRTFVIGSPDIDIMLSDSLPDFEQCMTRYDIPFRKYGIMMYHPVVTEVDSLSERIRQVIQAIVKSGRNYIIIYPNNDFGSDIILREYRRLNGEERFRIYPSIRFEYFLTLLKNADFIIGNSSAGIRESEVYGIPAIDIGTRQTGRYNLSTDCNIQHVEENVRQIIDAIGHTEEYRHGARHFGNGNSTDMFMDIIREKEIWNFDIQKKFIDLKGFND